MWKKRITRIFGILGRLSPHSQITIADLAREYEVSEKTIERDVQTLQGTSLGIFCEEGKIKISRKGCQLIANWMNGI